MLLLASLYAFDNRRDLHATFTGRWYPVLYHNAGVEIAGLLGPQSHVLTLAPTLPLEGGLQIYPELATGPFALRAVTMTIGTASCWRNCWRTCARAAPSLR